MCSHNTASDFGLLKDYLHEFILTDDQKKQFYNVFTAEMSKGLNKETRPQADLKNFVTYVQDLPTGNETGNYLSLDLGGSNFRVLLLKFNGTPDIKIEHKTYELSHKLITGTGIKLFDYIAACLADFVEEKNLVEQILPLGFTFSFPCTQIGLSKARLMKWTKGFTATGVVNEEVGRLLIEAIQRRGNLKITLAAILNDTVGTLMSCAHRYPDCRIGLIVGTGCNACYVEKVENIEILEKDYQEKPNMVINVEWGALGESGCLEFIRTDIDRYIDCKSVNKGNQLFEKMLSGMYLGEMVRWILYQCARENLIFSDCCAVRNKVTKVLLNVHDCITTKHVSDVEGDKEPNLKMTRQVLKEIFNMEMPTVDDVDKFRFICQIVSKRSGELVGIGISSLVNRMGIEKVAIGVDGSVFRFHPKYQGYMKEAMMSFIDESIKFELVLSDDGSGRGAALIAAVAYGKTHEPAPQR